MNKKGLSEVITTVLLILLVLGAIVLIWTIIRPMIQKSSEQISADALISSLSIPPSSVIVSSDNNVTLKVKRNADPGNITGVNVILETASGQRKTFKVSGAINELESKTITIPASQHGITEQITQVLIAAVVTNAAGQEVSSSITTGSKVTSSTSTVTNPTCTSNWACSSWSTCSNNQQTRTCTDSNNCNPPTNLQSLTQSCTSQINYIPTNGLVGYWKFDETSGTTFADSSGNTVAGTGSSGTISNGAGKILRGGNFNGLGDYVNVPDNNNLDNFSAFSISAWIYKKDARLSVFLSKRDTDTSAALPYLLYVLADGSLLFYTTGSSATASYLTAGAGTINQNAWYHIVATFSNSTNTTLYVNGAQKSATFSNSGGTFNRTVHIPAGLKIGTYGLFTGTPPDSSYAWNGTIDEVAIWNRALSSTEVSTMYNAYSTSSCTSNWACSSWSTCSNNQQTRTCTDSNNCNPPTNLQSLTQSCTSQINYIPTNGLVGYWKFDENSGVAVDSSGNGNNGGVVGGVTRGTLGAFNKSYVFDGSASSYVDAGNANNLDITGAMSVAAWVNPISTGSYQGIVVKDAGPTVNAYEWIYGINDANHLAYYNPQSSWKDTGIAVSYGSWQHVVFVYNGSSMMACKNAACGSWTPISTPSSQSSYHAYLGSGWMNQYAFRGSLDEVAIWNRTLSTGEISTMYSAYTS